MGGHRSEATDGLHNHGRRRAGHGATHPRQGMANDAAPSAHTLRTCSDAGNPTNGTADLHADAVTATRDRSTTGGPTALAHVSVADRVTSRADADHANAGAGTSTSTDGGIDECPAASVTGATREGTLRRRRGGDAT